MRERESYQGPKKLTLPILTYCRFCRFSKIGLISHSRANGGKVNKNDEAVSSQITKTSKQTMTDCPNINCNLHIHWWKQSQGVRKKISLFIYFVLDNWALLREQGSSWKVSVFKAWKETACLFGLGAGADGDSCFMKSDQVLLNFLPVVKKLAISRSRQH